MYDKDKINELAGKEKAWDEKIQGLLKKRGERKEVFQTTSGIEVKRLFTPSEVGGMRYRANVERQGVRRSPCRLADPTETLVPARRVGSSRNRSSLSLLHVQTVEYRR